MSLLLSDEENDIIFGLLGPRCTALATAIVQLWSTVSPDHDYWSKVNTGALCFVKDNNLRSYFFRLYSLLEEALLWEHELYKKIDYKGETSFMHTFEGEESVIAFNFASEEEACMLMSVVNTKVRWRSKPITQPGPSPRQEVVTLRNKTSSAIPVKISPIPVTAKNVTKDRKGKQKYKQDKGRKLTKADIGTPSGFKHVVHVGFDMEKRLERHDPDGKLKGFLEMAGLSQNLLKDRDTRMFINDFIASNGGLDAVKLEASPDGISKPSLTSAPLLPVQTTPSIRKKVAPPAAPVRQPAPAVKEPVPINANIPPPPIMPEASTPAGPPPPPLPTPISPNVPPPPPMAGLAQSVPEDPPSPIAPAGGDNPQNALMDAIRSGTTLKKVNQNTSGAANIAPKTDLLSEIRQGIKLKSVTPNTAPKADRNSEGLAWALSRALADRARAIRPQSDSSDSESSSDNWI